MPSKEDAIGEMNERVIRLEATLLPHLEDDRRAFTALRDEVSRIRDDLHDIQKTVWKAMGAASALVIVVQLLSRHI